MDYTSQTRWHKKKEDWHSTGHHEIVKQLQMHAALAPTPVWPPTERGILALQLPAEKCWYLESAATDYKAGKKRRG